MITLRVIHRQEGVVFLLPSKSKLEISICRLLYDNFIERGSDER